MVSLAADHLAHWSLSKCIPYSTTWSQLDSEQLIEHGIVISRNYWNIKFNSSLHMLVPDWLLQFSGCESCDVIGETIWLKETTLSDSRRCRVLCICKSSAVVCCPIGERDAIDGVMLGSAGVGFTGKEEDEVESLSEFIMDIVKFLGRHSKCARTKLYRTFGSGSSDC